ncbi:RNA polymerase sigma-70 factor [Pontibacillus marinus]|uniref:RNA polymerase sigma factor n=1 Tax=Pontibacillus marinus BH030004 = DSM 16465 TaxID=1385511 RepID=A0A0A5HRM4_9BACI|nr:RNA polymerase sigma-70 factor [Pontibacillus marinus]KGX86282.1 RNA polymerase sigma factor [Pontibacillus marinus BH030004 = DSM 16465]
MQISNDEFRSYQPLLFSLGYRMLGSIAETEDVVQDTFLQAYQVDERKVENKKAYLCKMMTNRCLDVLKSSRVKREQYIGPWNPEPLLLTESGDENPADRLLQKEGLSIAYLRMMEHLTPEERAVLLLRDVFEFSHGEAAEIVGKKSDACRKIYSRAKKKILDVEEENLPYEKNRSIVNHFIRAFQNNDREALLKLVSENVTLYSDGGGKVRVAIKPVVTSARVIPFLFSIGKNVPDDFYYEIRNVNGQPALVNFMNGGMQSIVSFFVVEDEIQEVYITMNPEKLPVE